MTVLYIFQEKVFHSVRYEVFFSFCIRILFHSSSGSFVNGSVLAESVRSGENFWLECTVLLVLHRSRTEIRCEWVAKGGCGTLSARCCIGNGAQKHFPFLNGMAPLFSS